MKQQLCKERLHPGVMFEDKGSSLKKHHSPPDAVGHGVTPAGAHQALMMPSLASLCSYDDDSDPSECASSQQLLSTSSLKHVHRVESKPDIAALQFNTAKAQPISGARPRTNSGKACPAGFTIHQSKLLPRTGRCNLLEKLLQKEANADMGTILLCFRAFASRGLV